MSTCDALLDTVKQVGAVSQQLLLQAALRMAAESAARWPGWTQFCRCRLGPAPQLGAACWSCSGHPCVECGALQVVKLQSFALMSLQAQRPFHDPWLSHTPVPCAPDVILPPRYWTCLSGCASSTAPWPLARQHCTAHASAWWRSAGGCAEGSILLLRCVFPLILIGLLAMSQNVLALRCPCWHLRTPCSAHV